MVQLTNLFLIKSFIFITNHVIIWIISRPSMHWPSTAFITLHLVTISNLLLLLLLLFL